MATTNRRKIRGSRKIRSCSRSIPQLAWPALPEIKTFSHGTAQSRRAQGQGGPNGATWAQTATVPIQHECEYCLACALRTMAFHTQEARNTSHHLNTPWLRPFRSKKKKRRGRKRRRNERKTPRWVTVMGQRHTLKWAQQAQGCDVVTQCIK